MTASAQTDGRRPLSDRAREWLFRVYYAHLISGDSPEVTLDGIGRVFTVEDEEWRAMAGTSPYLPDPRDGRVAETTWQQLEPDVAEAFREIIANRASLEASIQRASSRWRLDRMPAVDRALLTVGCFELLSRRARPVKRVINRTVELAKRYGEADSKRFVNGILDQIRKDHGIEIR